MELLLYQTLDNENVINKDLILKYTINIKLKDNVGIINPVITLNDKNTMDFNTCNYAYLPDFKRYYFIRSIENVSNDVWNLNLESDVLESFKNDILYSVVEINTGLKNGDYYASNPKIEVTKDIDIYRSDITLINEKNIVLSSIGGS